MEFLSAIQEQSERIIKELKWADGEIDTFISEANRAIGNTGNQDIADASLKYSNLLTVHSGSYEGSLSFFVGWTHIYDNNISKGTKGHKLHLTGGGVGNGSWSGKCDIRLADDGTIRHLGTIYSKPKYHYGHNDWKGYHTGFDYFHDHVASYMLMQLPQFEQEKPIFVFFDENNNRLGLSVPDCNLSFGIGGGSVFVES